MLCRTCIFFPIVLITTSLLVLIRCLQNYIPAHSLTLSCPVCRQTSILPEKGVSALQNNFFITNLMDVLQRTPDNSIEESSILETVTAVVAGKPLSCPNHEGNVSEIGFYHAYQLKFLYAKKKAAPLCWIT